MSELTITVSDGEDFYRIPLDDLTEAYEDGFYVPALNNRTIVSDGVELFEIPLSDLAEAAEDGFRDALTNEREAIAQAKNILQKTQPAGTVESPAAQHSSSISTPDSALPEFNTAPEASLADMDGADLPDTEEPQGDGSAISKFLLPASHLGTKNAWQVMLVNAGLHGLILLVLAMIILPAQEFEIFMEITSAIEPKDPVKMEFEAVELDQPLELETDPVEMDVTSLMDVESETDVTIDLNDMPLNIPEKVFETDSGSSPRTNSKEGEMAGRSKAGRSALVARRGGSSASEAAVMLGLQWMAKHQDSDGGWSFDHTGGECKGQCSQPGELKTDCRNAATGLALLAMLGAGNTPYSGDFQKEVRDGVMFLLKNSKPVPAGLDMRGEVANNTAMYTQAIAATALCEILAMTKHEIEASKSVRRRDRDEKELNGLRVALTKQLRPAAQAAITFIVNAQHQKSGGWGYDPGKDGDTSILGWQVMALKSAVHAGIPVPANTVRGANVFLTSVQTKDGWFGYRKPENKPSTTAIGIISRMLSGMKRDNPQLKMGVAHLSARGPEKSNMYYNYYATQVMLHYGGEEWRKWNAVMREQLVKTQVREGHAAGSWNLADSHGRRAGRLYMTSLCTMTLEVYYRHLPLYGEPDDLESEITSASR